MSEYEILEAAYEKLKDENKVLTQRVERLHQILDTARTYAELERPYKKIIELVRLKDKED